MVGLGKVFTAEDVLLGWVDVGCVGLLVDRLGFPAEWDERYDIVVVSNERSCTRVSEEDVIDSDFFHHTFCTVHTVHTVCSPFTLVVNRLLTTIAHLIFSSVLAEPQYIY